MGSFKLDKSASLKKQIQQGGIFLIVIGIPVAFLWYIPAGVAMIVLGIMFALGGTFASD